MSEAVTVVQLATEMVKVCNCTVGEAASLHFDRAQETFSRCLLENPTPLHSTLARRDSLLSTVELQQSGLSNLPSPRVVGTRLQAGLCSIARWRHHLPSSPIISHPENAISRPAPELWRFASRAQEADRSERNRPPTDRNRPMAFPRAPPKGAFQ